MGLDEFTAKSPIPPGLQGLEISFNIYGQKNLLKIYENVQYTQFI